jgi:hypothetical protein
MQSSKAVDVSPLVSTTTVRRVFRCHDVLNFNGYTAPSCCPRQVAGSFDFVGEFVPPG